MDYVQFIEEIMHYAHGNHEVFQRLGTLHEQAIRFGWHDLKIKHDDFPLRRVMFVLCGFEPGYYGPDECFRQCNHIHFGYYNEETNTFEAEDGKVFDVKLVRGWRYFDGFSFPEEETIEKYYVHQYI